MSEFVKLFAWSFLIALIFYIVFSITQGTSGMASKSISGYAFAQDVKIISFPECIDTDNGKAYKVPGHTYNIRDNVVHDDYCENTGLLTEYFCNNAFPDRINVPCDCFDGMCR